MRHRCSQQRELTEKVGESGGPLVGAAVYGEEGGPHDALEEAEEEVERRGESEVESERDADLELEFEDIARVSRL